MTRKIPVTIQLLADDNDVIAYRKKFSTLLGSVTSAILLQQILFRFKGFGYEPYYKFREPCVHPLYKPGESWTEELAFTASEFDYALKRIGTKVTRGMNKKELYETAYPERLPEEPDAEYLARFEHALRRIVIYWTDSNRVTKYDVNVELLDKFINSIYLENSSGLRYLQKSVAADTLKRRRLNNPRKLQTLNLQNDPKTPSLRLPKKYALRVVAFLGRSDRWRNNSTLQKPARSYRFRTAFLQKQGHRQAAQSDFASDPLWLAFRARWKECTGNEIEVQPKLEASYRDSARRMHQKGVTEDQVRRLVDQWIGEGKFHFLFNFAADRIDPILSADGAAARQGGAAWSEADAPPIPPWRETNRATKPQPTTRVDTILKPDWLPEKPLTAATAWDIAYNQMELQFDANTFGTFLRHAQLMDYEPESRTYVVTVHNDWAAETCQQRLYRSIRRIVSDADLRQESAIKFMSQKDWAKQSLEEGSAVGD